jgi:hypothetical protein
MRNSLISYTKCTYILTVHVTNIYDPLTWDINMTLKERNILKTVKIKATCICHILRRNFPSKTGY